MEKIYNIVLAAQEKAIAAAKAGISGKELDGIARRHICDAGYGEYFGHSLGHGVGLEIHEQPRLSPKSKQILEAGDVVTIAAQNNNFVLSCNSADNYPYASRNTDLVKVGDYLYHPIVTDSSQSSYMVQPLILSKQDASKAAFDFYNGVDYEGDTKTGYLTNTDTNNYLKLLAYPSKNSAFEINISEGVATIEAKESEFKNTLLNIILITKI